MPTVARKNKTMTDRECIQLLQRTLPRLRLRWAGFRKVRGQVCKRIAQRIGALGLSGEPDYQAYLEDNPGEWAILDNSCRITISRFYRDQGVFRLLEQLLFPDLARIALCQGKSTLTCWCAGCASGEEPYSLAILWRLRLQERFPGLRLNLLATDADETILARARQGVYQASSLKELPPPLLTEAFVWAADRYRLKAPYRDAVQFLRHDLRHGTPGGPFDLILCRNCAFTYFEESLQREVLTTIREALVPGGLLIIGIHEKLPPGAAEFEPSGKKSGIYKKR